MQPDILSDEQANQGPQSQFWMPSILNPGIIVAGDASNPGMIDSGIESRSSTLSTYPESSTFNGDNSVDEGGESYVEPETGGTGGLECPQEGCGARLKRFPDVKRHLKEQHQCAHPNCQDDIFRGKFERDKHEDEAHPDDVLGFKCGSCELKGTPKRFVRVDKLKGHFRSIHRTPGNYVFRGFQCEEKSCLPASPDGGIFFASRAHLEQHTRSKHADGSGNESRVSTTNVSEYIPSVGICRLCYYATELTAIQLSYRVLEKSRGFRLAPQSISSQKNPCRVRSVPVS
jgi:hypothetical protein